MNRAASSKASIGVVLATLVFGFLFNMPSLRSAAGWSNGGFSGDPENPNYGTHDWIAEHALDWLPTEEKQYILDNLEAYLYGTELPDNYLAPDGIGDTIWHHAYFNTSEVMVDDWAAFRASWESERVTYFLSLGDLANASKAAGIMSHYIADVAQFGHVMDAYTPWGAETHHSDYEYYVNAATSSYVSEFNSYLSFDGNLSIISAYNATRDLAYDSTFDTDGNLTCVWMDQNFNWSDPIVRNRAGESLNLAVNYLADVLHTIYVEATGGEEDIAVFPARDVALDFENVTAGGLTTVNKTKTGPEPPPTRVVEQYYDIDTTANYTDRIVLRIIYGDPEDKVILKEEEESLQLVQWNETTHQWESITTHIDKKNNCIRGETSHLSIFGVTRTRSRHDIAIVRVTTEKTVVGQGYSLRSNVTVANQGDFSEIFDLTAYANTTSIGTLTDMTLASGLSETLTLGWNTAGLARGNYTISFYAQPVANETDVADNALSADLPVFVTIPGDVDVDRDVDIYDIVMLAGAYDSKRGEPRYFTEGDFDNDGDIDIYDIVIAAGNYGENW